jgi:hypothetical protein
MASARKAATHGGGTRESISCSAIARSCEVMRHTGRQEMRLGSCAARIRDGHGHIVSVQGEPLRREFATIVTAG